LVFSALSVSSVGDLSVAFQFEPYKTPPIISAIKAMTTFSP
jgi:hypothetical protein